MLPKPVVTRLCTLYRLLAELAAQGRKTVSSTELSGMLGVSAYSIRKDIAHLGEIGTVGAGYEIAILTDAIAGRLNLAIDRNCCIVGLGRLGSAVLDSDRFQHSGFRIVAGFDSSINRLETLRTDISLYPAYQIAEIVAQRRIELGIIAVPAPAAQQTAERLIEGGVRGILNFSSALIRHDHRDVFVTNMDFVRECTILAAHMELG
ncbi:MAG: redox-sensing transcriptional repressor Rex [Chitinivibrionales bacterium]